MRQMLNDRYGTLLGKGEKGKRWPRYKKGVGLIVYKAKQERRRRETKPQHVQEKTPERRVENGSRTSPGDWEHPVGKYRRTCALIGLLQGLHARRAQAWRSKKMTPGGKMLHATETTASYSSANKNNKDAKYAERRKVRTSMEAMESTCHAEDPYRRAQNSGVVGRMADKAVVALVCGREACNERCFCCKSKADGRASSQDDKLESFFKSTAQVS